MDRVNRRFLVISTLTAIPAALLMASLSIGINPEVPFSASQDFAVGSGVQNAVAQTPTRHDNVIQQVIGKQPDQRRARRPLFGGNSSSRPAPSANRSRSRDEPRGLFDSLFGRNKKTATPTHRREAANNAPPAEVDWEGIPFHDVHGNRSSGSSSALAKPIRPPTPTRVIRGNSSRVTKAPTLARRIAEPTRAKPLSIPKPPSESSVAKAAPKRFSASQSSRRSQPVAVASKRVNRSNVASIYGDTKKGTASYQDDDVADLVPRVRRKVLPPVPTTIAKSKVESAKKKTSSKKLTQTPKLAAAPKPKVDGKKPEVKKMSPPKAQLQTPTVAVAKPKPHYMKPVDPKTTEVPPAPALAAASSGPESTPAASVSHRSGPPLSAFVPLQAPDNPVSDKPSLATKPQGRFSIQQPSGPSPRRTSAFPAFEDRSPVAQDGFGPVGSGVASRDFSPSASQPLYETAQRDQRSYDPYGSRGTYESPRMSTTGQRLPAAPMANTAQQELAPQRGPQGEASRSAHDTAAIPMHSIPGHEASPAMDSAMDSAMGLSASGKRVINRSSANRSGDDQFKNSESNRMRNRSAVTTKLPVQGAHIVTSELPGIRVVTNGPSEVMIRENAEYEIRVENRGSIDAKGVLVRALIPDWADIQGKNATVGEIDSQGEKGAQRLVWIIDSLPAGTSEQMSVRLMAARRGKYNLDVDWTLLPQRSVAHVMVHEPQLELAIEGPDQVVYGHSQTYKVRVLNPGDGTAPNVVFTLSPNSATPQTQRIGDIPAGKEAQFEVELTAQDLGDLKIQGLAMGDLELRAEGAKTIRVSAAELEAILGGPELKYQNTEAVYSLQLQNLGSATSEKVMASLRIPAGAKYLGGIEGATLTRDLLKWEVTELAPGASRDYQFRCNMTATGEHLFAFDCKGTAAGQANVSIATRVESIADLVLTIHDPPAPAPIGAEVLYEIVVKNRGSREAKDVRAIAQFSHGIEPQRVEGQSGEVVTGQVLFDTIPRIGAGEEVHLRVIAQADKAGHHRFRTEVRSGDTVLVAEEATHYMSPRADRVSRRSSDAPLTR